MTEYQPRPGQSTSESLGSAEKSSDTKKKKKIGSSIAREVVIPPPELADLDKAQSMWQRIAAIAEKKEIDKQFLRPVEQADNDAKLAMPNVEKDDSNTEDAGEKEAPLESLGAVEQQETVKRYGKAREHELRIEAEEISTDNVQAAETMADKAYLAYVEKQLLDDPELEIEELLVAAEMAVHEEIDAAAEEAGDGQSQDSHEGEIFLHGDIAHDDAEDGTIPLSENSDGGNSSNNSSGGGNTPPPGGGPTTAGASGIGGSGGSGNTPPPPMYYGGMPPFGGNSIPSGPVGSSFGNAALVPHNMITKDEAYAYERQAMGRGLLVGGIIGYLIGRRRGRIKTEKRLIPIQKKLEKEVIALHNMVFEKEQAIRRAAAEKASVLRSSEERQIFTQRLMQAEVSTRQNLEQQLANNKSMAPKAERLGRVVVEAPLGAFATVERLNTRNRQESVRASLDMNRKVETYTTTELKEAAAKIRVEGVTLKQLWDSDRLDEPALRRVMTEFIEGGSIHAALNQELLEKELRIEKDPKLRDVLHGQKNNMAAIAGAALLKHEKVDPDTTNSTGTSDKSENTKPAKKRAASPEEKAKTQEKLELAGGLIILGIIIVLILRYI